MLSVVMLNVIVLSVITLCVIMVSVITLCVIIQGTRLREHSQVVTYRSHQH